MDVDVSDVSSKQTRKQSLAKSAGETAAERTEITSKEFKDFHLKNGSSQGQHLELTTSSVSNALDSGWCKNKASKS